MLKYPFATLVISVAVAVLAGCSSAPYTPVATPAEPLNPDAYTRKVDSFVVLLDTSGSMVTQDEGRPRIYNAQDIVASFNSLVPPLDYDAGLVTYGKGSSSTCTGYGVATTLYGLEPYTRADFAQALGSIECAASTTPIVDAIDSATGMLVEETGPVAVIIVSDFNWSDRDGVTDAIARLKAQHGSNICLHTVKVGEATGRDALIASLTDPAGCDSAVKGADLATGEAMSAYVVDTLLTPHDLPLQYEKYTVSAEALFDFDKYVLKPQGIAALQNLGAQIRSQGLKVKDIDIIGHTDSVGSDDYNLRLSERRAMAVKSFLVDQGVSRSILGVSGMGESQPVASNDTDYGRALNRRVEILVGTARPVQ